MTKDQKTLLAAYVRQAKRHGPESVFETAVEDEFSTEMLVKLALEIRALHPRWKMPREHADEFVVQLRGKVPDKRLQDITGLSMKQINLTSERIEWETT